MAAEFVFDKYEDAPWLYAAMALSAVSCAVMLLAWKKKNSLLPAVLICVATAALLIGYASKNWEESQLTPVEDMVRYGILYGTMIVNLICIGLAVHLNLQHQAQAVK